MAWSIESMIVFRAIQGFVGGAMVPTVFATGFAMFSGKQRAMIPAILGIVSVLAPTLGVWSSGDRALGESQMVESGRYCANGFTYMRLEDFGHWFPLEAGEEVTKVLSGFHARVA